MRKSGYGKVYLLLFIIILIVGFYFISTSDSFERNLPTSDLEEKVYWNGQDDIAVQINDDSGIKGYTISGYSRGAQLFSERVELPESRLSEKVNINLKRWAKSSDEIELQIEVRDISRANFFAGNKKLFVSNVIIDTKRPSVSIISSSYGIQKGGSATVIFRAYDDNLKEVYIEANGRRFNPQKFVNEAHYISLIARAVTDENYKAQVIAIDKAGNRAVSDIKFFLKDKVYRTSNIELKDDFLQGKITTILEDEKEEIPNSLVDRFKLVNEALRQKNEDLIVDITSQVDTNFVVNDFSINPFYPLKNGKVVASFGDKRNFFYNKEFISTSYHLGLDLASTKEAEIVTDNKSYVAYADYNGIYGNMLVLYHGLGLYTLYGHCTDITVAQGSFAEANSVVAKTGITGLALGDHLHFGVAVQGVEVRPEEWMDKEWIKLNVYDVINSAKSLVNKRSDR